MLPEGLFLHSKKPATGHSPVPYVSSPYPPAVSSHLRLSLPSYLLPLRLPTKRLYEYLGCGTIRPVHLVFLHLITKR
jgi:hypothetical protein